MRGRPFLPAAEFFGWSGRKVLPRVGNTGSCVGISGQAVEKEKGDLAVIFYKLTAYKIGS
jgi:hypothetical protein